MANFDELKERITERIRTNGTGEITGQVMQDTLLDMVDTMGEEIGGVIEGATASVDNYVGQPSVGVSLQNKKLNFVFRNLKGEQGNSAVFDPETGNILATLHNTTGYDDANAMSQKAVTDELTLKETAIALPEPPTSQAEALRWINSNGVWAAYTSNDKGVVFSITPGKTYKFSAKNVGKASRYAWLKDNDRAAGQNPHYADNCTQVVVDANTSIYITAPADANYMYFRLLTGGTNVKPDISEMTYVKEVIKEIEGNTQVKELAHTDEFYGKIEVLRGGKTSGSAGTNYYRKFEIEDTSRTYYATYRIAPNLENVCGVAYYDADDNFICSQYSSSGGAAVTREKRLLSIPSNTKYVYVFGADTDNPGNGYVIPRLYVAGQLEGDQKARGIQLKEVARFAMLGNGSTNVTSQMIPANGNTHFVVKMQYDSWTMPSPTESTGCFIIRDLITASPASYVANTGWLQNNFDNPTEAEFILRPNALGFRFSFRATAGQVVNFVVYEVVEKIGDATVYGTPPPNVILYNVSKVNTVPIENASGSSYISSNMVNSAWAVMFPSSYTPNGKPTQVIAMLHGASGYVSPDVMGYTMQKWLDWRNLYLNNGYAVLEINGWGTSTQSDNKSRHWACPAVLETIDKAFETLRANYNVADKLMLHGTSMGGATSWAYALTRPNKVAAVGLFSPATLSWIMLKNRSLENDYELSAMNWQYADVAAAVADDYQRIIGYDPIIRAMRFNDGAYTPPEQLAGLDVLQYGQAGNQYVLVGQPLQFPVRIWHGDADPTVPISLNQIITNAYRRGGHNVSIRVCPNETHAICTGGTQYVCDEAVDYFNTFR